MEELFSGLLDYDGNGDVLETFEHSEYDAAADLPQLPEFNKDEALPNKKPAILLAATGVQATLKTLSGHLQTLRSPDGSKMNPAKTCQDIKQCYPQKKSGQRLVFLCLPNFIPFLIFQSHNTSCYAILLVSLKQVTTG